MPVELRALHNTRLRARLLALCKLSSLLSRRRRRLLLITDFLAPDLQISHPFWPLPRRKGRRCRRRRRPGGCISVDSTIASRFHHCVYVRLGRPRRDVDVNGFGPDTHKSVVRELDPKRSRRRLR